jgi:hypothetical protein
VGEGLSCRRCGGALVATPDPEQLLCGYCGFAFLRTEGDTVAAYAPAGRYGRRRAAQALTAELEKRHVMGFAIEQATLVHLPYWQVEGKLVGWQRYREKVAPPAGGASGSPSQPAVRDVEETISRDVVASFPACDVRGYGLLGVAHRVAGLSLRPLSLEALGNDQIACAPVTSAAAALRSTRLYYGSRLTKPHATTTRQRLSLLRTRVRLIYYPVWRLRYRSGGRRYQATLDGMQGHLLKATLPHRVPGRAWAWSLAASASGFAAGIHPVAGALTFGGWLLWRLRSDGLHGRPRELMGWLSRELSGARTEVREGKG